MMYGLALAGGGARGAYHTGVYKALSETGQEIKAVTGTSIGAVTAAMIAAGDADKMGALWQRLTLRAVTGRDSLGLGCSLDNVRHIINRAVDEEKVRRSAIRLGFEVLDGAKSMELFIEDVPKGKLCDYLTAAVCMPIFKPQRTDGRWLIDGGALDNMPVDMLIQAGCDEIIASDDGGIGRMRSFTRSAVNIVNIKYRKFEGGILDFDARTARRTIRRGYIDAMKEFGAFSGEIYAFLTEDYLSAVRCMGKRAVYKAELLSRACKIEELGIYTVDGLLKRLHNCLKNNENILKFVPKREFNCFMRYIGKKYSNIL